MVSMFSTMVLLIVTGHDLVVQLFWAKLVIHDTF